MNLADRIEEFDRASKSADLYGSRVDPADLELRGFEAGRAAAYGWVVHMLRQDLLDGQSDSLDLLPLIEW